MADCRTLPGSTFLVPSGPQGYHLFVLILGPINLPNYGNRLQVAMVSATSVREGVPYDPSCLLHPGEHPFIQHPSYIAYRHLRIDPFEHINSMVGSVWKPHEPFSPALLQRVLKGVCESRMTPREFKLIFRCY